MSSCSPSTVTLPSINMGLAQTSLSMRATSSSVSVEQSDSLPAESPTSLLEIFITDLSEASDLVSSRSKSLLARFNFSIISFLAIFNNLRQLLSKVLDGMKLMTFYFRPSRRFPGNSESAVETSVDCLNSV